MGLAKQRPRPSPARVQVRILGRGLWSTRYRLSYLQCSIRIKSPGWRSVEPELSPRCRRKQRRVGISHRTYLPPVFQRPSGVLKTQNTTNKRFHIMDKTARSIELDKLTPIVRIDLLDHSHFTRRDTVVSCSSITASVIVHLLKVIESITRDALDRDLAKLVILGKLVLGSDHQPASIVIRVFADDRLRSAHSPRLKGLIGTGLEHTCRGLDLE